MNANLQTLFSNLSSTSMGYESIADWLDRRCSLYESVVTAIGQHCVGYTSDISDNTAIQYLTEKVEDGYIKVGTVLFSEIKSALDNATDTIQVTLLGASSTISCSLQNFITYIQSSVNQLYAAADALKALAAYKAGLAVDVLSDYKNRLTLRFASVTSGAAKVGYSIISALQSKSLSVQSKIQSILTVLGVTDSANSDLGLPEQTVDGYSFSNPCMTFVVTLNATLVAAWNDIANIMTKVGKKIADALLGVFHFTTEQTVSWWMTITGQKDAYGVDASVDTRTGPCFADFQRVVTIQLSSNPNYTSVLDRLKYICDCLGIVHTEDTVLALTLKVLGLSSGTNVYWSFWNHFQDRFKELMQLWVFYDVTRYSKADIDHLNSIYASIVDKMTFQPDYGYYPVTIEDFCYAFYALADTYKYTTLSTSQNAFVQKLSSTQYLRVESLGGYFNFWRNGTTVYCAMFYRPIDKTYVSKSGNVWDPDVVPDDWGSNLSLLTSMSGALTANGWFDGTVVYSDGDMMNNLIYASQCTAAQLAAMDYQRLIDAGSTIADANSNAKLVYSYFCSQFGFDTNGHTDYTGGEFASLIMSGRISTTPKSYSTVDGILADALLEGFLFINDDAYYCTYLHTIEQPIGHLHCMTSKEVMYYGLSVITLGVAVAVTAAMIVASVFIGKAAFSLEAAVGNTSWNAFGMDADGKRVTCNKDQLKAARKLNFQLKIINSLQALLGKGASEAVSATASISDYLNNMRSNADTSTVISGDDGISESDVDAYSNARIVKLIAG